MNQEKLLNYRLITWDRHIKNVAGLNMLMNTQPWDNGNKILY